MEVLQQHDEYVDERRVDECLEVQTEEAGVGVDQDWTGVGEGAAVAYWSWSP